MPSAGAVIPPSITPMRKHVIGKPSSQIDTGTFIELDTETPDCRIFFSTDGTKPNPFKMKEGGRETTYRYKGPFTLKLGKRTLKVVAVTRDGLHESNVVTKTFQVADAADLDDAESIDSYDSYRPTPTKSYNKPWQTASKKKSLRSSKRALKEAWGNTTTDYMNGINQGTGLAQSNTGTGLTDTGGPQQSTAQCPEGPFNPTNYSGTQVNFWGVSNGAFPTAGGTSQPYGNYPSGQLGYMTNNMLNNLVPKVSLQDLKALVGSQEPPKPMPAIEYKDPELKPFSPGGGDWKAQLEHVYAHLLEECKNNIPFRTSIGEPKLGKIVSAEFDEEDDAFLLTVAITKHGKKRVKPKPKPAPPKPQPEPVKTKAKPKPKPAPPPPKEPEPEPEPPKEPEPEPEPDKQPDPYFVTEEYEAEGTLKPWPAFDAERDCERLRKAMKGMGTDEEAIINIMGYRTSVQRQEIVKLFKTMFGKDLREELKGETSGGFANCLKSLCLSPDEYDATEVKQAVKGLGTDDDALIEILCTRTNGQIAKMNETYKRLHGVEMEKDVKDDTSGNFKRVLVSQIQGNRDENSTYDLTQATADAKMLYDAGEKQWGTDESKFHEVLCTRSFAHLRAVFEEYKKLTTKDIEEAIKSEFSGDIKNSLLTIVRVIKDKPLYFANKMKKAMKGLGTDDDALVRVVVSRCETDMVQIKDAFEKAHKQTLPEWIRDDTSGDYMQILLALTGARPAPEISAEEMAEANEPQEIEEVEEEVIEQEGTLQPADPFDPKKDCEVLKKAMKGLGTDEAAIIGVMGKRSNEQRMELCRMYKDMYGKDLRKELKSETSGNFKDTLAALCMTPPEYDANELRRAMKGLGTDEDALVEIICTRSTAEMATIVQTYKTMHNRDLEKDIVSETSGHIKRLLVSMVQANRPDGNTVNRTKARKDAKDMYEAGENKMGTDESRFNVIICARSYPQLRATFEEYEKAYNKSIEDTIKSEMSGDLKKGMLTVVRCIKDKQSQFAKTLYDAMSGLGTNDESLVRTVVTRCEVDMVQIKQKFEVAYKQPLGKFIADDISGDYKKIILHLTGDEQYIKKK